MLDNVLEDVFVFGDVGVKMLVAELFKVENATRKLRVAGTESANGFGVALLFRSALDTVVLHIADADEVAKEVLFERGFLVLLLRFLVPSGADRFVGGRR